jgi:hypothetical protein
MMVSRSEERQTMADDFWYLKEGKLDLTVKNDLQDAQSTEAIIQQGFQL